MRLTHPQRFVIDRGRPALAMAWLLLVLLAASGGGGSSPATPGTHSAPGLASALAGRGSAMIFSGPIVISSGGTYSGAWESTDPDVNAVTILTSEPVTIVNSMIRSRGNGIWSLGANARITVRNTVGVAVNPDTVGGLKGCFVDIGNFDSVVMENNHVEGWSCGIRALNYGSAENLERAGQTVVVRFNRFSNIDGRRSDGAGGYQITQDDHGQAIGMNSVRQANATIAWNEIINLPYQSKVEDIISTFESGGTPGNPIRIENNFVSGGYHGDPAAMIDYTGAGINLGDCPSSHIHCAHVQASGNFVVSFSNSGIGIAGGHHISVFNNRVVSAQRAPGGVLIGSTWRLGYGFWNFYDNPHWAANRMHGNYALVVNRDGFVADNYTPSATPESVYDNVYGSPPDKLPQEPVITETELREHKMWSNRAQKSGVVVGLRAPMP